MAFISTAMTAGGVSGASSSTFVRSKMFDKIELFKQTDILPEEIQIKINLLGSSFGSYLILNRLIRNIERFNSVLLMSPCVKIIDFLESEHNLTLDYYDNHQYKLLYGKVKLYKDTYLDFCNNDVFNNKKIIRNNDIYIIHGEDDRVINMSVIEEFCNNLNISLKTVENAHHEFYSYLNQVNKFIFDKINNS